MNKVPGLIIYFISLSFEGILLVCNPVQCVTIKLCVYLNFKDQT